MAIQFNKIGERIRKPKSVINILLIVALYLGVIGIYVGFVNMYIWLLLIIVKLSLSTKDEIGLFFLFVGSSLFGRIFASFQIVIAITILFSIIGILVLLPKIRHLLKFFRKSYAFFTVIVVFFFLCFLFGEQNIYAQGKIIRLVIRGYLFITSFVLIFNLNSIDPRNFAYLFLLLSLFYLSQAYQLYGVIPSSFLDFNYFREAAETLDDIGSSVIITHSLGYLSCGAITFYLSRAGALKTDLVELFLLSSLAFCIILVSGARQAILCFLVIFAVALLLRKGKITIPNFIIASVAFIVLLSTINIVSSKSQYLEQMTSTENSIDKRLNRDIKTPIKVMKINPLFGIGFGGYPKYGNKNYPHNMVIELICEEGIIGMTFVSFIVALFSMQLFLKKTSLFFFKSTNKSNPILFLLLFFMRSMISGDLSANIVVFAIFFCFDSKHSFNNYRKVWQMALFRGKK